MASVTLSLLAYLSCGAGSAQVFVWFQNIVAISALLLWISILTAYLKFFYALRAQGIPRSSLPFRSRFQPYTAWSALVYFVLITIFNGFWTFPSKTKPFDARNFVTAYVDLPIYALLIVGWKVWKRTRVVRSHEVDLKTGKAAIDAREQHEAAMEAEKGPRKLNALYKAWNKIV